ncbi:MAG TPA: hypothetical protein VGF82_00360 [Terracidiphilus sp.]|jgi:hypothetical protein
MSFFPYGPVSSKVVSSTSNRLIARLLITTLALGGAGSLGMAMLSGSSKAVYVHARDEVVFPEEIFSTGALLEGQIVVENPPMMVNVEAYNRKRKKDIAADSKKLLSLAIELRSEVNDDAGSMVSPDAAKKVKEIEKLARRVKESMTINIAGPM